MKECFKCGETKPLDDFYKHPQMADGHLNKCKGCFKKDCARIYRNRRSTPEGVARDRARGRDKYARLYRVGPNWQAPAASRAEKKNATNVVNNAVRDGKIVKPKSCSGCGRGGRIHGHHADYSKPFEVAWLCPACHRKAHAVHPERVRGVA